MTGAARGIGTAIAHRLAADGLRVALIDLDEKECEAVASSIAAQGGTAVGLGADITDEIAVEAVVQEVADVLGPPTVLVNNAGIIRDDLILRMSVNDWDAVIDVHLRGTFLMTRAVRSHMTAAGFGRIVSLSSTSALGKRGQANYAAAKAGIQGFTKTVAIELGRYGVTANAVAPGFIETDMTAATAVRVGMPFEEFKAAAAGQIPVGRTGTPDDNAHVVSYFASEDAGFVYGQILYVAGGPRT